MQVLDISKPSTIAFAHSHTPAQVKVLDSQYQRLVSRLTALNKEANTLELKKQHLLNTNNDLTQLLSSIKKQADEQLSLLKQNNKALSLKKQSIEGGLINQYKNGRFLEKMGQYWSEFVKQ